MSFSGHFSFKKIPLKLLHSSANRSGENERQWARFNFDSGEEGPDLLFSCRHMFSASFQSL